MGMCLSGSYIGSVDSDRASGCASRLQFSSRGEQSGVGNAHLLPCGKFSIRSFDLFAYLHDIEGLGPEEI